MRERNTRWRIAIVAGETEIGLAGLPRPAAMRVRVDQFCARIGDVGIVTIDAFDSGTTLLIDGTDIVMAGTLEFSLDIVRSRPIGIVT